jgi:hypothetical protein
VRLKKPVKGWFKVHKDIVVIDRGACLFYALLVNEYAREKGIDKEDDNQEYDALLNFVEWLEEKWGVCAHEKHDIR